MLIFLHAQGIARGSVIWNSSLPKIYSRKNIYRHYPRYLKPVLRRMQKEAAEKLYVVISSQLSPKDHPNMAIQEIFDHNLDEFYMASPTAQSILLSYLRSIRKRKIPKALNLR